MEISANRVLGFLVAVALIICLINICMKIPTNLLANSPFSEFSSPEKILSSETSYLWNERGLDVVFSGVVVFTALFGILDLMRKEEEVE
ncbi:MAG: hypothetical protein ACTSV7_01090 [Candidatus Baldrarchaeia archaeon]